ncbi:ArgS-related anticodon-binding protein NrtL [Streptomyces sp. MA5143a]|uniref:ArgS-related anticodon-binding protein NrtL n=1 Tax=Streptomyces sp. MA5143a TaxID=2083010 RepID=UPI000D1AAB19|nr:DALR anticodon-binding domain-containing protein [Streptomyces sp. MA5143a]
MTPVELSRTVLHAVRRAVDQGELSVAVPARAVVTPPGPGGSGDYATNIALQLARPAGRPPLQVAEILRPHLSRTEGVAAVEITGPGFLNIHLDRNAVASLVRDVLDRRGHGLPYGHSDALAGQVLRLRIPYDIRAEVVADAVGRIVASQGGRVEVHHVRPQVTTPGVESHTPGAPGAAGAAGALGAPGERPPLGSDTSDTSDASDASEVHTDLAEPRGSDDLPSPQDRALEEVRVADGNAGPRTADASEPGPRPDAIRPDRQGNAPEPIDLRPVPAPEDPAPLGPDALRWALLHPAAHDRPRITADLLAQRASNPLFRVRYAHARARALTRNAATLGFTGTPGHLDAIASAGLGLATSAVAARGDHSVIAAPFTDPGAPAFTTPDVVPVSDPTTPLLTAISEYPHVLLRAATHRTPDRLARHLVVTADALLAFQHTVLPRGEEKPSAAHRARLALAEAAGTVLAGGLSLLGIDAPEYL